MAQGQNFAIKYASKVDERFQMASQAQLALNNDYSFLGVQTVRVYSVPTVPLTDYTRSGPNRYGSPTELENNIQELTIKRDRSFTFTIDQGNRDQEQMVTEAGKALSRQTREVVIPEYDAYVFHTLAKAACGNGATSATAPTKTNAYSLLLDGHERMGNCGVPDSGQVCFCSYGFYNLLKQDPAFVRYGDSSQKMLQLGNLGEVDGVKIVRVPSTRLPAGASFRDPPGLNDWLVEGRILYDCFVLDQKVDAVYYHGTAVTGDFTPPASSTNGTGNQSGG